MGAFDTDWDVVDDMMAEVFGGTVTIHRGPITTTGVTAEAYSQDYDVDDLQGIVSVANMRDFVIDVASYVFAGSAVQPREGDLIKEDINGTTHIFQVAPISDRPAAEWFSTQKPQWKIHAKLIGTE